MFNRNQPTKHAMTILKTEQHSVRIDESNPDHHLYRNNQIWWIHYTRYPNAATSERVRHSLKTRSLAEARRKRDRIFTEFAIGRAAQ